MTGNEWQKHPIVTGPEAPCILGLDCLRREYFKDLKGYWWAFGIAALETEEIKRLSTLPGLYRRPICGGVTESRGTAGAYCYYHGALAAIPHQLRLPDSHLGVDSPTREPRSDQQNPFTL